MKMPQVAIIVAEGKLDILVAQRILHSAGHRTEGALLINTEGATDFWKRAPRYNKAAAKDQLILGPTDLDREVCPSALIETHLNERLHPNFHLRIAVRAIESWLLADKEAMADLLRVRPATITDRPDELEDPKRALVEIARGSTKPRIRDGLVPREGGRGKVGPTYLPLMSEFTRNHRDPLRAAQRSISLRRALEALSRTL